jgi:hypothetical protein
MPHPKPPRNPRGQVLQDNVVDLSDDLLQRPGSVDDVSVPHLSYKRQISLSLAGRLFKRNFLFARVQHLWWRIQKDDQIRFGDKSANQLQ